MFHRVYFWSFASWFFFKQLQNILRYRWVSHLKAEEERGECCTEDNHDKCEGDVTPWCPGHPHLTFNCVDKIIIPLPQRTASTASGACGAPAVRPASSTTSYSRSTGGTTRAGPTRRSERSGSLSRRPASPACCPCRRGTGWSWRRRGSAAPATSCWWPRTRPGSRTCWWVDYVCNPGWVYIYTPQRLNLVYHSGSTPNSLGWDRHLGFTCREFKYPFCSVRSNSKGSLPIFPPSKRLWSPMLWNWNSVWGDLHYRCGVQIWMCSIRIGQSFDHLRRALSMSSI